MVFALSGCLLCKVQAQNLLQEALTRPPLPASLWDVLENQEGQLARATDPGLALVM